MVTVELNVNKGCIAEGEPCDTDACPIALAAINAGFRQVDVDGSSLSFAYGETDEIGYYEEFHEVKLPRAATTFISLFDDQCEDTPKPFKFRVSIPNRIAKEIKLKKKYIVDAGGIGKAA